jgi:hypothetical protein
MGEIMRIHCNACQKEWQCMTGCGLRHGRKEHIIAAFGEAEQIPVSEWLAKSQIPLYDFQYQTASCPLCKELVSVPVLRGIEDDEVFVGACPVCGNLPQMPSSEDVADIACPACGDIALEAEEIGHWD